MSSTNSNPSDRDFEAIHRAQRAHEPSMEEILASIRNIIADDPAKATAPRAPQPAPTPAPQIVYSKNAAAPHGDAPGLSQRPDANTPTVVWRRPQAVEAETNSRRASSSARSRCCRPRRDEAALCRSGPCRPILRFAAPSSPTAWCATCCGRWSRNGWTTTSRRWSSGWSGRKFRGSRAGGNSLRACVAR